MGSIKVGEDFGSEYGKTALAFGLFVTFNFAFYPTLDASLNTTKNPQTNIPSS